MQIDGATAAAVFGAVLILARIIEHLIIKKNANVSNGNGNGNGATLSARLDRISDRLARVEQLVRDNEHAGQMRDAGAKAWQQQVTQSFEELKMSTRVFGNLMKGQDTLIASLASGLKRSGSREDQ